MYFFESKNIFPYDSNQLWKNKAFWDSHGPKYNRYFQHSEAFCDRKCSGKNIEDLARISKYPRSERSILSSSLEKKTFCQVWREGASSTEYTVSDADTAKKWAFLRPPSVNCFVVRSWPYLQENWLETRFISGTSYTRTNQTFIYLLVSTNVYTVYNILLTILLTILPTE